MNGPLAWRAQIYPICTALGRPGPAFPEVLPARTSDPDRAARLAADAEVIAQSITDESIKAWAFGPHRGSGGRRRPRPRRIESVVGRRVRKGIS